MARASLAAVGLGLAGANYDLTVKPVGHDFLLQHVKPSYDQAMAPALKQDIDVVVTKSPTGGSDDDESDALEVASAASDLGSVHLVVSEAVDDSVAGKGEDGVPYRRLPRTDAEKVLDLELWETLARDGEGSGHALLRRALDLATEGVVTEMEKPIRSSRPEELYKSLQKQLGGREQDLAHVTRAANFLKQIALPPLESGAFERMRKDPPTEKDLKAQLGFERKTALFGMIELASEGLKWLQGRGEDEHGAALRARYHWIVQSGCAVIACAIKGKSPDEIHVILADSPEAVSRALAKSAQASDLPASEGGSRAATAQGAESA